MPDEKPIYAFAHIEKCGGTTLIETLRRNFPLGHVDLLTRDSSVELVGERELGDTLAIQPWLISFGGHTVRPHSDFGKYQDRIRMFTLLRDPVKRFISDYLHDVSKRGYDQPIGQYLSYPQKHNFIVRSLAGEVSLERAKEALATKIAYYGFVEHYDCFMDGLKRFYGDYTLDPRYVHVNYAMLRKAQKTGKVGKRPDFSDAEIAAVREANALDIELYDWALDRAGKQIDETHSLKIGELSATEKGAILLNRAVRNFWYKPRLGYRPGSMPALPRNRHNVEVLYGPPDEEHARGQQDAVRTSAKREHP